MSYQWQGWLVGCTGWSPKVVALLSSGHTYNCHDDYDNVDHDSDPNDEGNYNDHDYVYHDHGDDDDCITSLRFIIFVSKTEKGE